jgi:glycosyltransferase involved in cell wall biosynthesis
MATLSVIICTHNPRLDYLCRTLDALKLQTLDRDQWELLLIDNASDKSVETVCDISWHPEARCIREEQLGLTAARVRGIMEATGDLLVFVDDDNILAPDYLQQANGVPTLYPHVGVFGAGVVEPEFETQPDPAAQPWLSLLALRGVDRRLWTNNVADYSCAPYGAGICVPRQVANRYCQLLRELSTWNVLGRVGGTLFCGEDDLFSWLSIESDLGFGIFPELRVTHLISKERVRSDYLVRLVHGHRFSHAVVAYMLRGETVPAATALRRLRLIPHGLKNGWFSMRCQRAELRAEIDAAKYINARRLQPLPPERRLLATHVTGRARMTSAEPVRSETC